MKTVKLLLISLFVLLSATTAWADIKINKKTFPDAKFRNWVLSQEYGKDGVLTDNEIANVEQIIVDSLGIKNLKGIEYFTALKELSCTFNKLTTLDVSKNTELARLDCSENQLTTLDVSKNTALTDLRCYQNQIRGEAMDSLIASLPDRTDCEMFSVISTDGNEGNLMTTEQMIAAKAKGWRPSYIRKEHPQQRGIVPNIRISRTN